MFNINEIFSSIQGEGFHSGQWATFVRFSGCNLSCSFCDTDHKEGVPLSGNELCEKIFTLTGENRFIVLTGGEPGLQLACPEGKNFLERLAKEKYYSCVETNGTISVLGDYWKGGLINWLTVSPKKKWRLNIGNELKIAHYGQNLTPYLKSLEQHHFGHYFLQPVWTKYEGHAEHLQFALTQIERDPRWRLSVQTHKLIGLK